MIKVKIDVKRLEPGEKEISKYMKITSVYLLGLLIFNREELFVSWSASSYSSY